VIKLLIVLPPGRNCRVPKPLRAVGGSMIKLRAS
jgi:hypothetical protein